MREQRGFTLIEMVVFIVVLGVGITGTLAAIVHATRDAADPLLQLRAAELGQSYLNEIAAVPYDEAQIDGVGSESEACPTDQRSDWLILSCYGTVDDQPPLNAKGDNFPEDDNVPIYEDYRVTVDIQDWQWSSGGVSVPGKRVTVTVYPPGSSPIEINMFRSEPLP